MSHHQFAYHSSSQFLRLPAHDATQPKPFAIAGIPYDGAVSHRPGARFGPQAIRHASQMLCDGTHPYFDIAPTAHTCDVGDLRLPNTSLQAMRTSLIEQAYDLMRDHHMIWLGGDHSATLPLLQVLNQIHNGPVALLHFDAHCDTWTDHFGEPSGHGTWVYEAMEQGLLIPKACIQIGIRSSAEKAARDYVNTKGGRIFTARELRGLESPRQLGDMLNNIRLRMQQAGSPPIYLSVDIDCLDPAFAPGTGTPEPGGMSSAQVLSIIEELADLNWVGMDCVEVAPAYDHADLTSNAAAHFVWTYLCGQVRKSLDKST